MDKSVVDRLLDRLDPEPTTLVLFHFAMMMVWALLLIPTVIWWKNSILWVGCMSVYAAWVGHFSSFDAARAALEARRQGESEQD